MVHAMIDISEHANRVLNVVKAKYGLRTKTQAIERMTMQYEREVLEPRLRPEFVKSLEEVEHAGKFRRIKRVLDIFDK